MILGVSLVVNWQMDARKGIFCVLNDSFHKTKLMTMSLSSNNQA